MRQSSINRRSIDAAQNDSRIELVSGRKTRSATGKARGRTPRHGEADALAAEPPLNATLLSASLRDETRSHLDGPRRADTLLQIQQTHGNAYVQRLMQPSAATIQRQTGATASRTVPGLPGDVVDQMQTRLSDDPQAALDLLTRALAGRGSIDLSFLAGGTMTYVTDKTRMAPGHYGHTSLTPGSGRPRPCSVDIGPDAFRSVGDLYATVMHEWMHVLQFRRPDAASEAMDELEARLWEVENLELTGLWRNSGYMGRIRGDLDGWWRRLTDVEKSAVADRYQAAQDIITRMIDRLTDEQLRQQGGGRRRR
jgi:hypothetical protein